MRPSLFKLLPWFIALAPTALHAANECIHEVSTQTDAEAEKKIEEILRYTNQSRLKNDARCPVLVLNAQLRKAAFIHTQDMIDRDFFEHELQDEPCTQLRNRIERVGYAYRALGENISMGYTSAKETVLEGWMKSAGHRQNILNCQYTEIGIAVINANHEGSRPLWYYTQIIGAPSKTPK